LYLAGYGKLVFNGDQATPIAEDSLCHDVSKGEDQHGNG
jgi:hypothetical protein